MLRRVVLPIGMVLYAVLLIVFAIGFVYDDWAAGPAASWPATGFAHRDLFILTLMGGVLVSPLVAWVVGFRKFAFAVAPAGVLALVAYFVCSFIYYRTQEHLFDPFLQKQTTPMPEEELETRGDEIRILAIGGSTTRNYKLKPKQRYPATLGRLLAERYPEQRIRVHNAGVGFWTVKHSMFNYLTYARRWKPDVAVIMHAINDLYRSFSPSCVAYGPYDEEYRHYYGPAIHGALPQTFPEWLYERFLLRLDRRWYPSLRWTAVDVPQSAFPSIEPFERSLRMLVRVLREDGVRVVLITQPSIWKPEAEMTPEEDALLDMARIFMPVREGRLTTTYASTETLRQAHLRFNDVIRRVAADEGIPLADCAEAVERRFSNFRDDVHYKPPGAATLARCVAQGVEELPSLRRADSRLPDPDLLTAPPPPPFAPGP